MLKRTLALPGIVLAAGLAAATLTPAAAQAGATQSVARSSDAYFVASLAGKNEVPVKGGPKVGDKNGSAYVVLRISGSKIFYVARWSNIAAPTAFHIHQGKKGVNGDVKVPFFMGALPGGAKAVTGDVKADGGLVSSIEKNPGGFYVNLHTGEFPGGAVRAQLHRINRPVSLAGVLADGTHATIATVSTGAQEVPVKGGPKVGDPDGRAEWLIGIHGKKLNYATIWTRLDAVTNGHIHRGKKGKNGPVVVDLFGAKTGLPAGVTGLAGSAPVKGDIAKGILKNPKNWYANLHTTTFPGGAVRGQLYRAHVSW